MEIGILILIILGIVAIKSGGQKAEAMGENFLYQRKESLRYIRKLEDDIIELKEQLKNDDAYYLKERLDDTKEDLAKERKRYESMTIDNTW